MKYTSHILSDARGSVAGSTFTRGPFGQVIRKKVAPVQPRTAFQTEVRVTTQALASAWRWLTDAQRGAWNSLAQTMPPRTDTLGNAYQQTGFQLFVGSNRTRLTIDDSLPILTTPPAVPPELPAPVLTSITADTSPATLSLSLTVPGTGYVLIVWASPTVSPGITSIRESDLRICSIIAETATSPVDITADYQTNVAPVPASEGGRVHVALQMAHVATGFSGSLIMSSANWTI